MRRDAGNRQILRPDGLRGHHRHRDCWHAIVCGSPNKRHRVLFTGSVVYIAGSVPLHIYCSYIIWDPLMTWFPMWFSWFLLIVVYPAFLTLFAKLQYRN